MPQLADTSKDKQQSVYRRETKPRWLELRQEVFQLCDFCQPKAIVLSALIGWYTHQLKELDRTDSDAEPWIELTKEKIRESCLGLVSLRTIYDEISGLEEDNLLNVERSDCGRNLGRYLLRVEILNKRLKDLPELVNFPEPDAVPARKKGWEKTQSTFGTVAESSNTELSALLPKLFGTVAESTSALLPNLQSPYKEVVSVKGSEKELLPPVPPESDPDFPEETPDSDPTPPSRWPKRSVQARGFGGRPKKVRDTSRSDQLRAMREGSAAAAPPKPCPTSDTPPQATVDLMRFVRRWNELVPAAPVQWDPRYDNPALLAKAAVEEKFVVGFDELCRKCQALQAAKAGPNDWAPDFDWVLGSDKEGGSRWWKVLKGKYDWKTGPKSNGNSTVAAARAAHARVMKKYKAESAADKLQEGQRGTN